MSVIGCNNLFNHFLNLSKPLASELSLSDETIIYVADSFSKHINSERLIEPPYACEYLESIQIKNKLTQASKLKEIADSILFLSTLYPSKLLKSGVPIDYYFAIGQACYYQSSHLFPVHVNSLAELAGNLKPVVMSLRIKLVSN